MQAVKMVLEKTRGHAKKKKEGRKIKTGKRFQKN